MYHNKKTVITFVSLFMVLVNNVCAQEKQSFREWAQTPPMGWNAWNCYGPTVTEKETKANANMWRMVNDFWDLWW